MRKLSCKRFLFLLSFSFLFLAGCNHGDFSIISARATPVYSDGESFLSLNVSLICKEGDKIEMEIESPSHILWSFGADKRTIDGVTYYGSSRLAFPSEEKGVYHLDVMRQDGKRVQTDLTVTWNGEPEALPEITKNKGTVTWNGEQSLSWAAYNGEGKLLGEGKDTSGFTLPRDTVSAYVSSYDEKTGWISLATL